MTAIAARLPTQLAPPSADKRWKIVATLMRRHGYASHALIETLHAVQEAFGFVDEDAMRYVAASLRVPLSRVYGVVTFYSFFSMKPPGRHTCVLCTGTVCYIRGASQMLSAIHELHGIGPGETTPDGEFSLLTARCLGSCGLAPAAVFDGEFAGKLSTSDVVERVKKWTTP